MLPPRAIQFMGLNAVRALSLISLILVFSSTIVIMVNNIKAVNAFQADKSAGNTTMVDCDYIDGSTVPNQPAGVFWAIVASLLIIFQTMILFLSEVTWPMAFFDKYFPVLGTNFGLGPLGIFQALISTQILSHHVDDFPLVSAFFLFAIACINMLLGLIFREKAKSKRSITSWRAEAKGILPTTTDNRPVFINATPVVHNAFSTHSTHKVAFPNVVMVHQETTSDALSFKSNEKVGYGFGRQGEKAAGLRGFILQKPEESLPRYVTPSIPSTTVSRSPSSVSNSSSFYVPERQSIPPMPRREYVRQSASASVSDAESEESHYSQPPPTFQSSRSAL